MIAPVRCEFGGFRWVSVAGERLAADHLQNSRSAFGGGDGDVLADPLGARGLGQHAGRQVGPAREDTVRLVLVEVVAAHRWCVEKSASSRLSGMDSVRSD